MFKVYTDAAANGNPGSAGIGIILSGNQKYEQLSIPLSGKWDNHSAEWEAMRLAAKWLNENLDESSILLLYTDSQIVAKSLEKQYVKNDIFKPYLDECLTLLSKFAFWEVKWIPEKQNRGADNLAKQALQKAIKK